MRKYFDIVVILFLLFSGFITAQDYFQSELSQEPLSDSQKAVLKNLLPDAEDCSAEPDGDPAFYTHDLWDYIDGGAEAYHAQGFAALIHQNYLVDEAEVTVDIYDMDSPVQAFGIYALERSPEYHFLDIGLEGYGDEYGLHFYQGQYYIKLSIFCEDESRNLKRMATFAESISRRIGAKGAWPETLLLFPENYRIPHSEQYIRQSPMGHPFLAPVYSAQYHSDDSVCTLWLSEAETKDEAVKRAEQLAEHFKETGHLEKKDQQWIGRNDYEGEMIFIPKGQYLILLQSPYKGAEALLEEILKRIH